MRKRRDDHPQAASPACEGRHFDPNVAPAQQHNSELLPCSRLYVLDRCRGSTAFLGRPTSILVVIIFILRSKIQTKMAPRFDTSTRIICTYNTSIYQCNQKHVRLGTLRIQILLRRKASICGKRQNKQCTGYRYSLRNGRKQPRDVPNLICFWLHRYMLVLYVHIIRVLVSNLGAILVYIL